MYKIYVKFTDTWKKSGLEIDINIERILNNNFEITYNDETTIRDLLKGITKSLESFFYRYEHHNMDSEYEDINLKRNFSYIYDNVPTTLLNIDVTIKDFIDKLEIEDTLFFEANFAILGGTGDIWIIEGVRYYMNSRENTSHNIPHVHVQYKNKEVSISILDGEILAGEIKSSIQKEVVQRILSNKRELALAWNTKTDGRDIEIDELDFTIGG